MSSTGQFHLTNLQAGELDIYLKPKTVKPETPFNSDNLRKNHYELIDVTNCEDENFIRIQNARSIFEQNSSDSNVKTHFISSVTYIENEAIEKSFEDCQKKSQCRFLGANFYSLKSTNYYVLKILFLLPS